MCSIAFWSYKQLAPERLYVSLDFQTNNALIGAKASKDKKDDEPDVIIDDNLFYTVSDTIKITNCYYIVHYTQYIQRNERRLQTV